MKQNECYLKKNCNHIDCDKFCMRFYKTDKLFDLALFSDEQRKPKKLFIDKDGSDRDVFRFLKNICDNVEEFVSDGHNLYIHSMICGNGKTEWALKIVQSYIDRIWFKSDLSCPALFISVPRFLLALKDNLSVKSEYVEYIKNNIYKTPIVIWDDIGTKAVTSFESENLFSIIDNRISNNKANIFTSNLSDDELHKFLGDRLASRICNKDMNIEFVGADKRGLDHD